VLSQKEEVTFLKKSNQITFDPGGVGSDGASACRTESLFASFSSEKEDLLQDHSGFYA
jgi:hypothetical protein